jgi:hypothetical protein
LLLLCLFFISFLTKNFFNETSTIILGVSLLGGTRWNTPQSVQTCWNTFEPVETRFNPFRPVETCRNTFQSVQICPDPFPGFPPSPSSIPPPPPFPLSFWEGGRGGGREGEHYHGPPGRGRGGTKSPPPPPDFKQKTIKILALFLLQNLQNLCNLPLPPKGFSLSPLLLLKTT